MSEDRARSQTLRAVLGLRGLIVDGELRAGERVSELFLVDRLGISRTPARAALTRLREEGLLEDLPSGGFVVSSFSERDVFEGLEIRGTLEGMAARYAAERGVEPAVLEAMRKLVLELDQVLEGLWVTSEITDYMKANGQFHNLLVESSQSKMVKRALERMVSLPFARPNPFVSSCRSNDPWIRTRLTAGQEHHRCLIEAIESGEGARAQALAVEHSRNSWKYLQFALHAEGPLDHVPALQLIRR